MTQSAGVEVGQ